MSHEFLNRPDIGSALKQVSGEAVPKHFWIDCAKSGASPDFLYDFAERVSGERPVWFVSVKVNAL